MAAIENNNPNGDQESAGQLMGHDHNGHGQSFFRLHYQIVNAGRHNGIETG